MPIAKNSDLPAEIRPKGYKRMTNEEKITILTLSAAGKSSSEIARTIRRSEGGVAKYLASMLDTTALARATLKAGAVNLAERIIKKAEVREAIEVLSRPGIGVIEPPASQKGAQGFGIQVSVGIASCGTVVRVEGSNGGNEQRAIERAAEPVVDTGAGKFIEATAARPEVSGG